jgi:hypothetical protein
VIGEGADRAPPSSPQTARRRNRAIGEDVRLVRRSGSSVAWANLRNDRELGTVIVWKGYMIRANEKSRNGLACEYGYH